MQNAMQDLRRPPKVSEQTGLPLSSLYRMAKLGRFPRPIKIGPKASAWIGSEVDQWIAEQIAAARPAANDAAATKENAA